MINGRCGWCGTDALYVKYHDKEWGKPVTDDRTLFEFLVLESAQAGLSWITILRKRRIPQSLLRFRCRTGGPDDRRRCRTADAHGRHREKPAVNQSHDHECPAVPRPAERVRQFLRLHPDVLSRPETDRQHLPVAERDPGIVARIRCHEQRHEKKGIQILRVHDLLRPPAGRGVYQRSPDRLHLPERRRRATVIGPSTGNSFRCPTTDGCRRGPHLPARRSSHCTARDQR